LTSPQTLAVAYTAAWNTGDPVAVAGFFAVDCSITMNAGTLGKAATASSPWPQKFRPGARAAKRGGLRTAPRPGFQVDLSNLWISDPVHFDNLPAN
jgi:hypothetical protein